MLRDLILPNSWMAVSFPLVCFVYFVQQLFVKRGHELIKARGYMLSTCVWLAERFGIFMMCAIFLRWLAGDAQQGAVGEALLFVIEASVYIGISFIIETFLLLGIDWIMGKIRLWRHYREMKKRFEN